MYEKVNPSHPDKIADRIAGALVDLAYTKQKNPKIAVEVLIGHDNCNIIIESSCTFDSIEIAHIVNRIAGMGYNIEVCQVPQDEHLAENQENEIRCGDNGIFKGVVVTKEEKQLSQIAHDIYNKYPTDGKDILSGGRLIICQSNAAKSDLLKDYPYAEINPLGDWTGGPSVDTGATNRKLGSDMAGSVTGGGLHGKDLSKADVSVNIYCWLAAQERKQTVEMVCAIGDTRINGIPYSSIVEIARNYIESIGGFEKFAEWGLI